MAQDKTMMILGVAAVKNETFNFAEFDPVL